jgi:hypothetical protein
VLNVTLFLQFVQSNMHGFRVQNVPLVLCRVAVMFRVYFAVLLRLVHVLHGVTQQHAYLHSGYNFNRSAHAQQDWIVAKIQRLEEKRVCCIVYRSCVKTVVYLRAQRLRVCMCVHHL